MKSYQDKSKSELIQEIESLKKQVQDFRKAKESQPESIIVDTTVSQQAKEKLRESEEKYRTLVEYSSDLIFLINNKGNILSVNQAAAVSLGRKPEEIQGKNISEIFPEEISKRYKRNLKKVFETGENTTYESATPVGEQTLWISTSLNPVRDSAGKITAVLGVSRDITERKQAEMALLESERKYRLLVDSTDIGFVMIDEKGIVVEANEPYMRLAGVGKMDDIIGHSVIEWTAPESKEKNATAVKLCAKQGYIKDFETTYLHNDGTRVNIVINAIVHETSKGKRLSSQCRNITERKKAEESLKKSEEQFRLIAENTSDIISITTFDLKAKYLYVSPSAKSLLGYDPQDILGKSFFNFIHPEDKKVLIPILKKNINFKSKKILIGKESPVTETIEFRVKKKTGNYCFMQSTVNIIGDRLLAISRDITERKRAEDALQESEQLYQLLSEATFEAIFLSEKGICTGQNKTAEKMFGYTLDEALGRPGTEWIVPDDRGKVMKNILAGYERPYEVTALRKDGSTFPSEIQGRMMDYGGKRIRITALRDITERKHAEESLKKSEEQFRLIAENTSDNIGIVTFDLKAKYLYVSSSVKTVLGYDPEDLLGKSFFDFIHPEDKKVLFPLLKKYINLKIKKLLTGKESTISETIEFRFKNKIGNYRFMQSTVNIVGNQLLAVTRDITERKQAEEALRQEQGRAKIYLDIAGIIFLALNTKGEITLMNRKGCEILGYKQEDIVGKNWFDSFLPANIRGEVTVVFKKLMAGEVEPVEYYENPALTKDGEERIIAWHNTILKDDEGSVVGVLSSGEDITQRKQGENALRESEERFRRLFEDLGDAVFVTKVGGTDMGNIIEVNPAAEKQTGYTRNELKDMNIIKDLSISKTGELSTNEWEKKLNKGEMVTTVEKKRKKDGTEYWTEVIVTPIEFKGVKASLSINHDITERQQAEEQIKKSLKEKEILIKEIHHRVKNNLAVLSALLNMQSIHIKDEKAINAFKETQTRIISMSQVHSQLYNSEDFTNIDYKEYVKNLVSNVFYSSQVSKQVNLHLELDEVTLPIDKAIPCGLLLNELVTNALKHAFPKNRKGKLCVRLLSLEDNDCKIIVKDDGIGIPKDFNINKSKSLGLKLINLLTQQISGTLEVESKKGTEFRIRLSTKPEQEIR